MLDGYPNLFESSHILAPLPHSFRYHFIFLFKSEITCFSYCSLISRCFSYKRYDSVLLVYAYMCLRAAFLDDVHVLQPLWSLSIECVRQKNEILYHAIQ